MKANIEIQGTDDGGLDHGGSIEAVEKGECYIFRVCFIGKSMGLADGLTVENKR